MRLECLGAAGEVTGSGYLLTNDRGQTIQIDGGAFQGTNEHERRNFERLKYDPKKVTALLLTHSHLDHSGMIPVLVEEGFTGDIYMTPPTKQLVELTLKDQADVINKNGGRPLYSRRALNQAIKQIKTVPYGIPTVINDYTVNFHDAGHILGSSSIEIRETDGVYPTILFTGDVGNSFKETRVKADMVIMESTYGDRNHSQDDPHDIIQETINRIERQKKGTAIIAAFAVDRTQTILSIIRNLKLAGLVKKETTVLLDTPMGIEATKVYSRYLHNFEEGPEPYNDYFRFPGLIEPKNFMESRRIQKSNKPPIVIAGSGMMQGGRILSHLVRELPNKNSVLLITGFQGEGTLGRELAEGSKEVSIDELIVPVDARIEAAPGPFSSHAGQDVLVEGIRRLHTINPRGLTKVFITHGGESQRKALSERIEDELYIDTILPKRFEAFTL